MLIHIAQTFLSVQKKRLTNVRHGITLQMFVFLHFERKKDLHN